MAWFKADDKLHEHQKVRMLGRVRLPAMGLWILCGSWSADNVTGGYVPTSVVRRFDPTCRYAKHLVDAGMWIEDTESDEPGYRFHDWGSYQPTPSELEQRRKVRVEAGRAGGIKSGRVRRARRDANSEANEANDEALASRFASKQTKQNRTPG